MIAISQQPVFKRRLPALQLFIGQWHRRLDKNSHAKVVFAPLGPGDDNHKVEMKRADLVMGSRRFELCMPMRQGKTLLRFANSAYVEAPNDSLLQRSRVLLSPWLRKERRTVSRGDWDVYFARSAFAAVK